MKHGLTDISLLTPSVVTALQATTKQRDNIIVPLSSVCSSAGLQQKHLFPAEPIDYFLQCDFRQLQVYQHNILEAELEL